MDGGYESSEPTRFEHAEPGPEEVSEAVVHAYDALPDDLREQWALFGEVSPGELADRIRVDFDDRPRERREILIAYLAHRLGYRWYFNRAARLTVEPLWDVLRADGFARLSPEDREILWLVACTTQRIRQTLHPKAALAALALWRFGDDEEHDKAERLLQQLGLATRMHFLYDVVRALGRTRAEEEVPPGRRLIDLARLELDAGLWDVATLMGGLYLVRRFDPWYTGSPVRNLENACDKAALARPLEYRDWLVMMAEAAERGELTSSWLELVVEAAIRLTVGNREQNERLRRFHHRRLYVADRKRLASLYRRSFTRIGGLQKPARLEIPAVAQAMARLREEVEATAVGNPYRAMRLQEMLVERTYGASLAHVLREIDHLDPLSERLLTLYVRTCHLNATAVRFVREHASEVNWSRWSDVEAEDVATFRLVGDYEAAFGARDVNLLGVPIVHLDKDAAARVRYFQTSRTDPNSLARLMRAFEVPEELLVAAVSSSGVLEKVTGGLLERLEDRASQHDLREQVLRDLARVGAPVDHWEDIQRLPIVRIERALQRSRQLGLLVGAGAGGAAAALSPATTGLSSVLDVPFVMGLVADTCARHCWYYGFDPREHPELMHMIVAIALGGVEAASTDPAEVHRQLQRYLVRRSIILAAIGQGALSQIVGPALAMIGEQVGSARRRSRWVAALNRIARREGDKKKSFPKKLTRVILPAADAVLGAAFNVSLLYDLGESAQAVLADRFLDRKYPQWTPQF